MDELENAMGTILVIDDISDNIKVVAGILKEEGYKIFAATNGKNGIEIAKLRQPNLILLDVQMPEMDGYEVCKILKTDEETQQIPVIFLTARNDEESISKAYKAGGVDYISKPLKKLELIARVKTHIELSVAYKKIVSANNLKDKFFSIISHDLRGPIGGIMTLLEVVKNEYKSYDEKEMIEIIEGVRKSSIGTYNLLENLLQWAKISTEKFNFEPKIFNITDLIKECVEIYKMELKRKSIKVNLEMEKEVLIFGDENTIGIVFRNVLSNAIKFTKENESIEIGEIEETDKIGICIKDHGKGMNRSKIKDIMEGINFETVVGTSGEKGSGLGLVIVRDALEKNKGEMRIESEEGVGSCFTILFEKKK